jgi:hypothetical protein
MTPSNTPKKAREFYAMSFQGVWVSQPGYSGIETLFREVLNPEVDPRAAGVEWAYAYLFEIMDLRGAHTIKTEAIRAGILK